jgi:hypothetical protein
MAEVDFDVWLANYKPPEIKYYAMFDATTGEVTGLYPSTALPDTESVVPIDIETAYLINEGKIGLHSCFVDVVSGTFEIAEVKRLTKIDDVLHRIIDKRYASPSIPDVLVVQDDNSLIFSISEKYKKRKIHWAEGTEMSFLVTEYNDPNIVRHTIKFTINDLISKEQHFKDLDLNKKFSVYTKRLFPVYLFEKK